MSKLAPGPLRTGRRKGVVLWGLATVGIVALFVFLWRSPDAEGLSKQARQEFMDRQFDLAEADLDRVFRLRSPTPIDWMLRAQLLMARGRFDESLRALAKVPDGHPMAAHARLQEGQLELRQNHYAAAEAAFLRALKIDPKQVQALRELVYIYG